MATQPNLQTKIRSELDREFVPALLRLGFDGPDQLAGKSRQGYEYARATENGIQHLVIHFDKWKRPRFVLDFWVEPPDGVDALMQRGGTIFQARVRPGRLGDDKQWFRADRPWWQRLMGFSSSREQEAAAVALSLLPEIVRWLENPVERAPHINVMPSTFRGEDPPPDLAHRPVSASNP